ncbi:hypothetical protein ACIQTW_19655 [Paenarthrobacter sp. NPDC090517]|uniref:hypothetical protein n=1 Tax=Paenarthrobacter sp. NPDC090517 TaxID=3364381 RepID=UPI0037FEE5C3
MTIPKLALTFEEAAEACGYSVRTLKYQVAAGNLMARYANSKGVIRVEDLARWLDELPAEPKAGHRAVSTLENEEKGVTTHDTPGRDFSSTELVPKLFRTPEEVAPELGLSKSAVRDYARVSGIHTRVGNRIKLHQGDIDKLVIWIREHQAKEDRWWEEPEKDPFA